MKILQITSSASEQYHEVFDLMEDGKIYIWDIKTNDWLPYYCIHAYKKYNDVYERCSKCGLQIKHNPKTP